MSTRNIIFIIASLLATACRGGDSVSADGTDGQETDPAGSSGSAETEGEAQELTPSTRAQLQWKRNAALERDLMRALELGADQVCSELGSGSCTRNIHHIALGGSDPLSIGLYQPLPDTLVTTPVVFDRVVLSACTNRVKLDREGPPVVFAALDLAGGNAPAPTDDAYAATVVALYQRLLSRDPDPEELTLLERLTVGPEGEAVSAYDFAILSCFTIGTTTEFLFF
jgi:hypothetical protein